MNSFFSQSELEAIGFKKLGDSVFISRNCSIYGAENMIIGNSVRIDDFCILSGKITLGSHIHISAYCALYGSYSIELEDYSGLSPRCTIFSASDDFSGNYLIGPMCKAEYTNVFGGSVLIKRFAQIGAGCVVLPDLIIGEGAAVGAMSLINNSLDEWTIFAGIPAKKIKDRKSELLKFVTK